MVKEADEFGNEFGWLESNDSVPKQDITILLVRVSKLSGVIITVQWVLL